MTGESEKHISSSCLSSYLSLFPSFCLFAFEFVFRLFFKCVCDPFLHACFAASVSVPLPLSLSHRKGLTSRPLSDAASSSVTPRALSTCTPSASSLLASHAAQKQQRSACAAGRPARDPVTPARPVPAFPPLLSPPCLSRTAPVLLLRRQPPDKLLVCMCANTCDRSGRRGV